MLLIIHFRADPEKRTVVLVAGTVMIKAVSRRPFGAVGVVLMNKYLDGT